MLTLRKQFAAILFLSASLTTCLCQTTSHVAYVYVGTTKGVYLYDAASNGALTLVSGSPFTIAGNAIGSNGKYLVSLGADYVHSYPVASNGAINQQVSQINTQSYSGNECGTGAAGIFDHSGHDIYVELAQNASSAHCNAFQSFMISNAGSLTFIGSITFDVGYSALPGPITITANDAYAFDGLPIFTCGEQTNAFLRESSGALASNTLTITGPNPEPGWNISSLPPLTADPANHLAVAVHASPSDSCGGPHNTAQLASYTVDSQGNLTSTNTWQNMPAPRVYPTVMNMSPSGMFLAIGGNVAKSSSNGTQSTGLDVFHFNGANPITSYSGTLTTTPIDEIHWDSSNHLYALSNSTGKLYVYTVTPSSITAAPGSPYSIAAMPNALVVVAAGCTGPMSPAVKICAPAGGSTVSAPVLVQAAATVVGTISNMQLWVDGVKKYTASGTNTLNTSVSVAAGTHRFAVLAINTTGQQWESAVSATVK
jgi:hypothetical protein